MWGVFIEGTCFFCVAWGGGGFGKVRWRDNRIYMVDSGR